MSSGEASMAEATMAAEGLSPIPAPSPPPVTNSGFYPFAASAFRSIIAFVALTTIRIIRESASRPDPALPPSLVGNINDDCIGYITGAKPVRNALGDYSGAAQYRVWIDPATLDEPPAINDLIDVNGDRYVVNEIQRIPAIGQTIVAWKILCSRGQ